MDISEKNNSTDKAGALVSQVRKVTYAGLFVNIFLFIVKFVLGILGHSQAVVADAIHSLSDLITDFAIILGVKFWSKPADDDHPYGHRRIETLVTAFIGLALITAALGIGYSALSSIRDMYIEQPGWIAFAGALISIVFKEVLYHWTIKAGKNLKSSAVIANAWHHRTDALSSIPVAIAVAAAALNKKWIFLDHVGAIVVSIFILSAAWKIMRPAIAEFFDAGALNQEREKIQKIMIETSGVKSIHKLRTRRVGSGLYLDVHVQVDPFISVIKGHEISGLVKRKLLSEGPDVLDVIIHIEPFSETV